MGVEDGERGQGQSWLVDTQLLVPVVRGCGRRKVMEQTTDCIITTMRFAEDVEE